MARLHERLRLSAEALSQPVMAPAHKCAWHGCMESFAGQLPDEWRWLLLHGGDPVLRFDDIPLRCIDQDAVLCPQHARQLNRLLKHAGITPKS